MSAGGRNRRGKGEGSGRLRLWSGGTEIVLQLVSQSFHGEI